jgi:hypothetical protein
MLTVVRPLNNKKLPSSVLSSSNGSAWVWTFFAVRFGGFPLGSGSRDLGIQMTKNSDGTKLELFARLRDWVVRLAFVCKSSHQCMKCSARTKGLLNFGDMQPRRRLKIILTHGHGTMLQGISRFLGQEWSEIEGKSRSGKGNMMPHPKTAETKLRSRPSKRLLLGSL